MINKGSNIESFYENKIKLHEYALNPPIVEHQIDDNKYITIHRNIKSIEGMQLQINDMEERVGIMQSVEPVLENAIKTLQQVVDVRGMGNFTNTIKYKEGFNGPLVKVAKKITSIIENMSLENNVTLYSENIQEFQDIQDIQDKILKSDSDNDNGEKIISLLTDFDKIDKTNIDKTNIASAIINNITSNINLYKNYYNFTYDDNHKIKNIIDNYKIKVG